MKTAEWLRGIKAARDQLNSIDRPPIMPESRKICRAIDILEAVGDDIAGVLKDHFDRQNREQGGPNDESKESKPEPSS